MMTAVILGGLGVLLFWFMHGIDITPVSGDEGRFDDMPLPSAPFGVSTGVRALARAIADAEGFGVANAIPTRANNPGDLVRGDTGLGVLGAQKITVYRTADDGWSALFRQLQMIGEGRSAFYWPSMTILEMAQTWAGPDGGANWSANVAASLNRYGYPVSPESALAEILYA